MQEVNFALKEPCDVCGASMKCFDGCRKNLIKQKHTVQVPIQDKWEGLNTDNSWLADEMVFQPLNTFPELFQFHMMLCNNDKQMARKLAKQQLAAQNAEKEKDMAQQEDAVDGWETVPSRKSKRGHGKWYR